jgi:hypothetical protein
MRTLVRISSRGGSSSPRRGAAVNRGYSVLVNRMTRRWLIQSRKIQSFIKRMPPRQRAAATLLVGGVILPVAAVARLWGIWFCLPHNHCRPDEDAISAIAGAFRWGDLNPHVFNYPACSCWPSPPSS